MRYNDNEPNIRKKSQVRLKNKHKKDIYSQKHIREIKKLHQKKEILASKYIKHV